MFAENRAVKTFGNCPFNGAFLRCFLSKPEVKKLANESVACSGSTMGSVPALKKYVERMVAQMDASQCSAAGFGDSDQGYHNYLYHTGELDKLSGVRVHLHEQGDGVVGGRAVGTRRSRRGKRGAGAGGGNAAPAPAGKTRRRRRRGKRGDAAVRKNARRRRRPPLHRSTPSAR